MDSRTLVEVEESTQLIAAAREIIEETRRITAHAQSSAQRSQEMVAAAGNHATAPHLHRRPLQEVR